MSKADDRYIEQTFEALVEEAYRLKLPTAFLHEYMQYIHVNYRMQWFHRLICDKCQQLFDGTLGKDRLMIFMPPQHGKSEIVSRSFPAWALGRNADLKIVGASYNATLVEGFSRAIQLQIDSEEYQRIFPGTYLNGSFGHPFSHKGKIRTIEHFETINHNGFYKAVGVGGGLTGTPADIAIIDDPVKSPEEAYSITQRDRVWEWYNTVLTTRLHNNSKQLFIMTRWHEDDLAGRLLREEAEKWEVISIPALCVDEHDGTFNSDRHVGDALWEEEHSRERLLDAQRRNPAGFKSLYQQDPQPVEGLMYEHGFTTYTVRPATMRCKRKAYVDTADTGADYLCSIIYDETERANFVVDVLYTQKAMEYTEVECARRLSMYNVEECIVESNNGGRGFARNVEAQCRMMNNNKTHFTWFAQTHNKDVRIYSNSANVQNLVIMPESWQRDFPDYAHAMLSYTKTGKNAHDDAPDATTGTVERRQRNKSTDIGALFGY